MSNVARKILEESFKFWMKQITKEYQKKYGFDMGKDNKQTWDNESDAFRHAYMQAFLTIYIGEDISTYLGDKHEQEGFTKRHNSEEVNMDLWNNAQGVDIAYEVGNDLYKQYGEKFDVIELYPIIKKMIAEKIHQRMKAGKLITHPSDPRRYVPKSKSGTPTGQAAPVSSTNNSAPFSQSKIKTEQNKTNSQNFSDMIRQKYKAQQSKSNKIFNRIFKTKSSAPNTGNGHWVTMNGAHIFIEDK